MKQNLSIKNWIECWKNPKDNKERMTDLGSVDLWNRRADIFAQKLRPNRKQKRTGEIFTLLDQIGFQAKGARVLDIGSGPGAIAIPLAKAGAEVTALDISYKALDYLKANAGHEGLHIDTIECSWWDADIKKLKLRGRFDLVVTSMTPAVNDTALFDRMMSCSREFCYYSHFLQFGHNRDQEDILQKVLKKGPGKSFGGISPFMQNFMYLYLNGFRPLVKIQRHKHTIETTWEEAADRTIKSVEFSGTCSVPAKKKIREYYRNIAANGKCRAQSDGYTGMMVWNVNGRTKL